MKGHKNYLNNNHKLHIQKIDKRIEYLLDKKNKV